MVKENFAQPSKSIKILWTWLHNIGTLWDIILHNGVQIRAGLKLKPSDREIWFDYYENLGSTKLKPATEFFIFQDCMHLTVWYMRLINHLHLFSYHADKMFSSIKSSRKMAGNNSHKLFTLCTFILILVMCYFSSIPKN